MVWEQEAVARDRQTQMDESRVKTLRLTLGGNKRNSWEVREGDVVSIGRDPSCLVRIEHRSVSPVHCRVEWRHDTFVMVDLDSLSGITCRGRKHKHLPLYGSMEILVGEVAVGCEEGLSEIAAPRKSGVFGKLGVFRKSAKILYPSLPVELLQGSVAFFRKTPSLLISLLLHLLVLVFVFDLPYLTMATFRTDKILVDVASNHDLASLEEPPPQEKTEFDEPPLFPEDLADSLDELLIPEEPTADSFAIPLENGVIGLGGGGRNPGWGRTACLNGFGKLPKGIRDYIDGLRKSGVDVVFVMDSTSSMERFITEAKMTIDRLVSGLVAVVPNLRFSMVAYRDRGDDYVTDALGFTTDRYEILSFLENTSAKGGGDRDEAIFDGLRRAIRHLLWRPEAKKVILLIGDSGYHKEDERQLERLLSEFRKDGGIVHTIYVGENGGPATYSEKSVLDMYCRIARATGGDCVHLADYDKVLKVTLNLTFANKIEPDIAGLVEKVKANRSAQYISRKARNGDREWLLANLKKQPVYPTLVRALMKDITRDELSILSDYLDNETLPVETRWAALYILRKTLKRSFRYNPKMLAADQRAHLQYIRKAISDYPVVRNDQHTASQKVAPKTIWNK